MQKAEGRIRLDELLHQKIIWCAADASM